MYLQYVQHVTIHSVQHPSNSTNFQNTPTGYQMLYRLVKRDAFAKNHFHVEPQDKPPSLRLQASRKAPHRRRKVENGHIYLVWLVDSGQYNKLPRVDHRR